MNRMIYLKNVTTLKIDEKRCAGCGVCLEVCPHGVIAIQDKKARIMNRDACMECGACALNCAWEAIGVATGVGCAAAVIGSKFNKSGEIYCGGDAGCGGGKSTKSCC